ncbi:hypothetical protein GN244_ATG15670 [Phytophthora infestans]|uniref:Uncharacterized protein n=1 Tax=Phytophthora infestans TaxID=4787 RepID=A0A833RSZ8_PHYIN|nr:hypothetical protein GN244_ATG15670 [Phytophthora infestans]
MKMFESETEDLSDNKHIPENYERRDDTVRSAEASGTVATGAPALNPKTKVQERQVDIISVLNQCDEAKGNSSETVEACSRGRSTSSSYLFESLNSFT